MEIEIQFRAVYQRVYFEKMGGVKSGFKLRNTLFINQYTYGWLPTSLFR